MLLLGQLLPALGATLILSFGTLHRFALEALKATLGPAHDFSWMPLAAL